MDLSAPLILFFTQYVYVFAKSSQQLNVVHSKWLRIIPMSYIMSGIYFYELFVGYNDMAEHGVWRIFILLAFHGTGGWLGSWSGMWLHKRLK